MYLPFLGEGDIKRNGEEMEGEREINVGELGAECTVQDLLACFFPP